MSDSVILITEPLLTTSFTQYTSSLIFGTRLAREFEVAIVSPALGAGVASTLRASGVEPIDAGVSFPTPRDGVDEVPSWVLSWSREALWGTNHRRTERALRGRRGLRINLSMTNAITSDLWCLQSRPPSDTLASVRGEFSAPVRLAARTAHPAIELVGSQLIRKGMKSTRVRFTSSEYVAGVYRRLGYRVDGTIPWFLQSATFEPSTTHPSRDYILVYLGKETDVEVVDRLVHLGYPVRVFGGKSGNLVARRLLRRPQPNLRLLGFVDRDRLVDLYTNALFTAFPFTDESFGLVPIESMACGTPVLTYGAQGPGETVLDGRTGWLVADRDGFVAQARHLIAAGYPPGMSDQCRARAWTYHPDQVLARWLKLVHQLASEHAGPRVG